jgi:hypothetical protein
LPARSMSRRFFYFKNNDQPKSKKNDFNNSIHGINQGDNFFLLNNKSQLLQEKIQQAIARIATGYGIVFVKRLQ